MVKKRALYRDTLREIKHTLGRFLSILCITALGTAFFSGVKTAGPVMERTFDEYAAQTRMADIRLVSTVGFDDNDVRKIMALQGVSAAEPTYQADVIANINDRNAVITLLSMGDETSFNFPNVVEGRLPQNETECAMESAHFKRVQIGDRIKLKSGTDNPLSDTIHQEELTVVGKVQSPLYPSLVRGSSTLGSGSVDGFMVVHPKLFALSRYTDVYLHVEGVQNLSIFSEEYTLLADSVKESAEELGKQLGTKWYEDTMAKAKSTLSQMQHAYDEGVKKADREFKNAQRKIDRGMSDIKEGEKALSDGQNEINRQEKDGKAQIAKAREALEQGYAAYNAAYDDYLKKKDSMTEDQRLAAEAALSSQKAGLDAQKAAIDQNEKTMLSTIEKARATLDDKEQQLQKGKADLKSGQRKLNEKRADVNQEFEDAREDLKEAKEDIEDIPKAKWYVLEHDSNAGFVEYDMAADRMNSIAKVFPAIFFFIAALVCLTTMTRMVDEQRSNMGTLKALGYTKRDIAGKYLLYAATASVTGSVLGVFIGMWLFPYTIFKAYSLMFSVPGPTLYFHMANALLAVVISVGVTLASTMMACYSALHDAPSTLMRPRAPKAGKLILLERIPFIWHRLNFTSKVTARNLFRYKKRLFMTLIGIAGCTGLLLTGFGIRDSIKTLVQNQYGKVFLYQVSASVKDNLEPGALDAVQKGISRMEGVDSLAVAYAKTMDFTKPGSETKKQATLTIFRDDNELTKAISMQGRLDEKKIHLPQSGAIIDEKMSMEMAVKVGDTLLMHDGDQRLEIKIAGITENYIRHYVYLSQNAYLEATGKAVEPNQCFVNTTENADYNALCEKILALPDVTQVSAYTSTTDQLKNTIEGLDSVVWVLIISAAALAFVVMYNLTNINIGERIREIATLKVLGFTKPEVAEYVFRENILLSLLGIVLGCGLGIALHRFVMITVEIEGMMFGRQIFFWSFVVAMVMTFVFAMLVNLVMLPKLKKIDMVESLKTIE